MSQYNYGQQSPYQQLGANIVSALVYFFKSLVYILFICPFEFWAAATNRLASDHKACSLDILKYTSRWPYLSFCKKVIFEFLIDGAIFISYFAGTIIAFGALVYGLVKFDYPGQTFLLFLGILILTYYSPLGISFFRDLLTLFLLPFYKFLSWVAKPAQQLDIDMHNHPVNGAPAATATPASEQAPASKPAQKPKAEAAPVFTIDPAWQPYVGTEFAVTHRLANGQVESFQAPYQTFELTSNGAFGGTFLNATRFETVNGALSIFNGSRFLGDFHIVNPNNNGLVEIADANGIHYYLYRNA